MANYAYKLFFSGQPASAAPPGPPPAPAGRAGSPAPSFLASGLCVARAAHDADADVALHLAPDGLRPQQRRLLAAGHQRHLRLVVAAGQRLRPARRSRNTASPPARSTGPASRRGRPARAARCSGGPRAAAGGRRSGPRGAARRSARSAPGRGPAPGCRRCRSGRGRKRLQRRALPDKRLADVSSLGGGIGAASGAARPLTSTGSVTTCSCQAAPAVGVRVVRPLLERTRRWA